MTEPMCPHCDQEIAIRNPSGYCDHLYYPAQCGTCRQREGLLMYGCAATFHQLAEVARRLAQALKAVSLNGSEDYPLYSWCDEGWTCTHPECEQGRAALMAWRDLFDAPASAESDEAAP